MGRQTKQQQIDELTASLARVSRSEGALAEWFFCESQGHATTELDVPLASSEGLRVVVHGIMRASGGVVSVQIGKFRDLPRYLDDVIAEWSRDCVAELRAAADLLEHKRAQLLEVRAAS